MRYELYYWPEIQGRGEFVRLALEEAQAAYIDVARDGDRGMTEMMRHLKWKGPGMPPFAPPFLKAGDLVIAQTPNILFYLGERHGLAPTDTAGRLMVHQQQLTIADLVNETHEVHHPIATGLYYEDQKPEAARRAADFRSQRLPKFLRYFESVLASNPDGPQWLVGAQSSYADLSLFQVIQGLRYAFPRTMKKLEPKHAQVIALHDRVGDRPHIRAYLESDRRIPFNQDGIFRHYAELDD